MTDTLTATIAGLAEALKQLQVRMAEIYATEPKFDWNSTDGEARQRHAEAHYRWSEDNMRRLHGAVEKALQSLADRGGEKAEPVSAEPYAHEFGKSNGDGTFSVVIERSKLKPKDAVHEWPVKPLYAAPSAVEPVRVRELVWHERHFNRASPDYENIKYILDTDALRNFAPQIEAYDHDRFYLWMDGNGVWFDTLELAQAAAQEHYSNAIRSALEPEAGT